MAKKNQVDRRQFVTKTIAAGATVATTAMVGKTAAGCPLEFDADGNRVAYWCVTKVDATNPAYTILTWTECGGSGVKYSITQGTATTGDCGNAANDPNCKTISVIGQWIPIQIEGRVYIYKPGDEDAVEKFKKQAEKED